MPQRTAAALLQKYPPSVENFGYSWEWVADCVSGVRPTTSPTRVGDRVRVGRTCLGNPSNTIAVCYDIYDRGDGTTGLSLLFPNGRYDGFSPRDA